MVQTVIVPTAEGNLHPHLWQSLIVAERQIQLKVDSDIEWQPRVLQHDVQADSPSAIKILSQNASPEREAWGRMVV